MEELFVSWRGWRLKNTTLFLASLIVFFLLARTPQVDTFIRSVGSLGYLGAFIAGFFFVSTYTALPAGFVLFELAKYLEPLEIAIIAALGSMLGDYLIFRFIRDRVTKEIKPYLARLGGRKVRQLFRTPYFAWLLPLSGALIIASPLPDELGVSLIGASKMKHTHFLVVSYLLNAIGILLVVLLARSV